MTLRLHDRSHPLGPIPAEVDTLLRQRQQGHGLSEDDSKTLQRFLNDARDQRFWLACDCREEEDPPLLSIRRSEGHVGLVRHGAVSHLESCAFYRDIPEPLPESVDAQAGPVRPFTGSLAQLRPTAPSSEPGPPKTVRSALSPRGQSTTHPRLGRILMTLADTAQINLVEAAEIAVVPRGLVRAADISKQYGKLDALKEIEFAGDLYLGDVLCLYLKHLPAFLARFRDLLEPRFPPGTRAQGYVLSVVDDWEEFEGKAVLHLHATQGERTVEVHGRVQQYGHRSTPGPFLALGPIGRVSSTGRYEVLSAYLHPVFSKGLLVPVDSELERHALRIILGQFDYWRKQHDVHCTLYKPLFDAFEVSAGRGQWARPDFEILLPSDERVIVEVLGYPDDEAYMERKSDLKEMLESQSDVVRVVDWLPDSDDTQLRRLLTGIVLSHSKCSA
jgi:hypothetical protein